VKRLEATSETATSRRAFCQQACHAASLAALGILLPGCGGNPSGPSGGVNVPQLPLLTSTITGGAFTLTVDAASPLNTVGNAALVNASGRGFLVARTGNALTSTCTHQACTITGFQNQQYICPCHGSAFTLAGTNVSGPAPRPLQTFGTSFAAGILTVATG
jgi:nitrite reductase/ring-hydroxylating ferredoxin subunit